MSGTIRWAELIVLMCLGPDDRPDTVRGVVRSRSTWEVDDDAELDSARGQTETRHPVLGRMFVQESTARVARHGERVRLERPDGSTAVIFGADTIWTFGDDAEPTAYPRATNSFGFAGQDVVRRPSLGRWDGTDFTTLRGPIEAVELLGREAWSFELAPPAHKPYPLQMIVDAESGVVLRQANRDFGSEMVWESIEIGVDLPESLFGWDGPTREPVRRDATAEHEREMAERRAWLDARGITAVPLAIEPKLLLHEWDDAGAFVASVELAARGSLVRRPRSDDPWEVDLSPAAHRYRWSDDRWDWHLAVDVAVDAEQLALLKVQLAKTT